MVIRNGTIVDGSGSDPFAADVAITGGLVSAIGKYLARWVEEIDARSELPELRRPGRPRFDRPGDRRWRA